MYISFWMFNDCESIISKKRCAFTLIYIRISDQRATVLYGPVKSGTSGSGSCGSVFWLTSHTTAVLVLTIFYSIAFTASHY